MIKYQQDIFDLEGELNARGYEDDIYIERKKLG